MDSKLFDTTNGDILSLFLDSVEFNYSVIDKDGNYLVQNNKMVDAISHGSVRAAGIDRPSWEDCKEVMKLGKKVVKEEPFKGRYYMSIKQPLFDKGQCIGIRVLSFDITDRRRAEQLAKEKEMIAEKLALTEAFAGFMAHELRTPIASLNTCLDTIAGNEEMQDAVKRQRILYQIIAKGKQTIKEANTFIDMLLLKLRTMGKGVKKAELSLCLILEDVSDALALYPFTEEERVQVIWDKKDAFVYLGDSLHTQHIILNLLKNALKAIREEDKGKINISFEQGEDFNKLIFVDTAKGIAPELLPTIFDAFVTKDTTKKGTGLGLAYCKMIMLGYGGDITCESELGEYTKFTLTFPKVQLNSDV